jgi:hypothetical protein
VKSLNRIGWTGVLTVALSASAQAGTSTGTFTEFSDISIQQVVNGQDVGGVTNYSGVSTTLAFSLVNDGDGYFYPQLTVGNSLYSFAVPPFLAYPYQISVVDGIPGQSADIVSWSVIVSMYHEYNAEGYFYLTDPSGEFIGPNGDGSPDDVSVQFTYTYFQISNFQDSGFIATASVSTIPEPSSIVMAISGALVMLAVNFSRKRRRKIPYKPR